ncbi:MAG: hypothetical protein HY791_39895 [Deltaproteobacteria bacterium]|nr:hypothetical protein [Deltaproteobacteria bacterium]
MRSEQVVAAQPSSRASRLAIAVSAFLVSLAYFQRIRDFDLWWHMATGRWIWENKALPAVDTFSYTVPGQRWRYVNWLADLVLFGWFEVGGIEGLVVLQVLLALGFCSFVGLTLFELGARTPAVISTILLVGMWVQPRFTNLRPMCLGALCLSSVVYLAVRFWKRRDSSVVGIAPIVALWLPIHGAVIIAVGVLGVLAVAALLDRRPRRDLALVGGTLAVVSLIFASTSLGRDTVFHVFAAVDHVPAILMVQEWAKVSGSRFVYTPLISAAIATLLLLTNPRKNLLPIGLALLGFALSHEYQRNVYESLFLFAPALGLSLSRLTDALAPFRALGRLAAPALATLAFNVHLSLMKSGVRWDHNFLALHFGLRLDPADHPTDTAAKLSTLPRGRVLHDFALGGWLIWHRSLPDGVFADGRTVGLYERFLAETYAPAIASAPGLERVADQYDVTYGLARYDSPLMALMTISEWVPLEYGTSSALFIRKSKLGILRDLPTLEPLRYAEGIDGFLAAWYSRVFQTNELRDELYAAIRRSQRAAPNNPALIRATGYLDLAGYPLPKDP